MKMLYGGFAESKPSNPETTWVVRLPEDDPEALAMLLNAVHGTVETIPKELPEELLYGVTVLTDKYDMAKTLRPWAQIDLRTFRTGGSSDFDTMWHQDNDSFLRAIWIARELGDQGGFEARLRFLAMTCSKDDDGSLFDRSMNRLDDHEMLSSIDILGTTALGASLSMSLPM
ncbi:hypothetical protein CONLIGDRAFT_223343 [Coniochaeta ligniaria NRRL 30616]|uniref:BTB domain-containing protein n=1 Tax=Coniochaeta ligniaria NRRL 30616 TaxID=1408157 RepID=A0A1J7IMT2_9PEZI|nr:hypothetical protein CONLIGDRAFT_223343 [Coniochaeta ligniaria NRRL 30616]